jgi:hypothetical protein
MNTKDIKQFRHVFKQVDIILRTIQSELITLKLIEEDVPTHLPSGFWSREQHQKAIDQLLTQIEHHQLIHQSENDRMIANLEAEPEAGIGDEELAARLQVAANAGFENLEEYELAKELGIRTYNQYQKSKKVKTEVKKRLRAKQEIEQKLKQEAEDVATIHARAKQHLSMEEREELQRQQNLLQRAAQEEAIQVEEQAAKGVKRPHTPIGASKTEQEEEFKHNPEQQKEYLRTQAYKYGFNPDTFTQELLNQIQAQEEFEREYLAKTKKSKPRATPAKSEKKSTQIRAEKEAQAKHEADIRAQEQQSQTKQKADRRAHEADMRAQHEADLRARQEAILQHEAYVKAKKEEEIRKQHEAHVKAQQEAHIRQQQEAEFRQRRETAARFERERREEEEREQKQKQEKQKEKKEADEFTKHLEQIVKNWNAEPENTSKPIPLLDFVYTYRDKAKAQIAFDYNHPSQRKVACELCLEYSQLLVEKLLGKNQLNRSQTISKNFKQLSLIYHPDKRERYPSITDENTWKDIYKYIAQQLEACRSAKNCSDF